MKLESRNLITWVCDRYLVEEKYMKVLTVKQKPLDDDRKTKWSSIRDIVRLNNLMIKIYSLLR